MFSSIESKGVNTHDNTEKIHYYLLRLLEESDCEIEEEIELVPLME